MSRNDDSQVCNLWKSFFQLFWRSDLQINMYVCRYVDSRYVYVYLCICTYIYMYFIIWSGPYPSILVNPQNGPRTRACTWTTDHGPRTTGHVNLNLSDARQVLSGMGWSSRTDLNFFFFCRKGRWCHALDVLLMRSETVYGYRT
jgi:hypothetical protein